MSDMDDRLLGLVDGVVDADEERLPLLTLREAQAAVELLRLLSSRDGEGAFAARHLAGNLARRLPRKAD
ncbi:hypothetical protein ACFY12_10290 [Streptomyces sp. NPDC001339]|uniref:hypothetical protein n=1 Tax=unclassified Streptomyces TaxID=2593676 RepID=UPI0008554C17|nr:hypothetical protein [Streptomyces sp. NBRC 110611]GAU69245.1 hypothetical protein SSP35_11_00640 [Streptomyces sp. NBRC 110611]